MLENEVEYWQEAFETKLAKTKDRQERVCELDRGKIFTRANRSGGCVLKSRKRQSSTGVILYQRHMNDKRYAGEEKPFFWRLKPIPLQPETPAKNQASYILRLPQQPPYTEDMEFIWPGPTTIRASGNSQTTCIDFLHRSIITAQGQESEFKRSSLTSSAKIDQIVRCLQDVVIISPHWFEVNVTDLPLRTVSYVTEGVWKLVEFLVSHSTVQISEEDLTQSELVSITVEHRSQGFNNTMVFPRFQIQELGRKTVPETG
ncbi:hypothetical protein EV359DRAFT_66891 [Lentinula novae-zelandiae]|nr:hypothetical protein EV359DRAFT_66891 [Lentinula novae-zelandiae]